MSEKDLELIKSRFSQNYLATLHILTVVKSVHASPREFLRAVLDEPEDPPDNS